jgi:hypothetical protein
MPGTAGSAQWPYPLPSDAPDGPGAFLGLIEKLQDVTEPIATVAELPTSGNWAGRRLIVTATPGAIWEWTGTAWQMHGIPRFATTTERNTAIPAPQVGAKAFVVALGYVTEYIAGSGWEREGGDSGWVNVSTFGSGVTTGSRPAQVRRIGSVVHARGFVNCSILAGGTLANALTFPAGYRPPQSSLFTLVAQNGNRFGRVSVEADGTLDVEASPTVGGTIDQVHLDQLRWLVD